jgi:hypothetical protein
MALLYPWATKEYLLWQMSLGQIIMYHNLGLEMKYPAPPGKGVAGMSSDQLRKSFEEMKALGLIEKKQEADMRQTLREKYGAIDDEGKT